MIRNVLLLYGPLQTACKNIQHDQCSKIYEQMSWLFLVIKKRYIVISIVRIILIIEIIQISRYFLISTIFLLNQI